MLLVTDTLFIGHFPMVHQGDCHILDNYKEAISREGNYFFCGYKAERLNFVEKKSVLLIAKSILLFHQI